MDKKRDINISKYLSLHLRHDPGRIGLKLSPGGWVSVEELLIACKNDGFLIQKEELFEVVKNNAKQRFAFDETGEMIRANQGHSVEVDLMLEPIIPPETLFHGTSKENVDLILENGLNKMARNHVHLSLDFKTAFAVGARHGKPVVFSVNALLMQENGYQFFRSANGVWLVDCVPPRFLFLLENK